MAKIELSAEDIIAFGEHSLKVGPQYWVPIAITYIAAYAEEIKRLEAVIAEMKIELHGFLPGNGGAL